MPLTLALDAHGLTYPMVIDPSWTEYGGERRLATARCNHTATLLANGKVLVVGGVRGSEYLSSTEIYDPATNAWTAGGNLTAARDCHTATLLANGKVLVAGGYYSNSSDYFSSTVSSTEVYDPTTNTWTTGGLLITARAVHTATLLANGKVLVVGGYGNSGPVSSTEIYDPTTNTWTAGGTLTTARKEHTATLLANGKVLVAGGCGSSINYLSGTEVYDPATNAWTAGGTLTTARGRHTATLLANGKILVVGGFVFCEYLSSTEVYDPATNAWTANGTLTTARGWHTATLFANGKVLVAGGFGNSGSLSGAQVYDPVTNAWTACGALTTARASHTQTLFANGKVLVVGGYGNDGTLSSAEFFDPTTNAWTTGGTMTTARSSHTATLLANGKVLVAGGSITVYGGSLSSTEMYDPVTNAWTTGGTMTTARSSHTATLLANGKVLVAGGYGDSGPLSSTEVYDPGTNAWTAGGDLTTARINHTATLLAHGKVLVAGGWGNGNYLSNTELYDPTLNNWTAGENLATARSHHTATLLANGKVLVAGGAVDSGLISSIEVYDPATNAWTVGGNMTTTRVDHTATLLTNGKILVAGGYLSNSDFLSSTELYDPETNAWTAGGTLSAARMYHTATLLANGKVLVAGGLGYSYVLSSIEVYDPGTNAWTAGGTLSTARKYHTATLLANGKVLVAAGLLNSGEYSETHEIGTFQETQTITFTTIGNQTFGVAPLTLSATASSGQPVSFSYVSGPATVVGSTLTITGAGTVVVAANQDGNADYLAAPQITQSITVSKRAQTITFPTIGNQTFGVAPLTLSATASSGQPVSFSHVSGPATVVGSTLTITGAGTVVVAADQGGNADFLAAPQVTQSITVDKQAQTITFTAISNQTFGVAPLTLSATASSGLPVSYSHVSGPATVVGSTLTITGAGTVVVAADQGGNADYLAATQVTQSITVGKQTQTITFTAIGNQTFGVAPLTLSATSSSGQPVSFSYVSGPATVVGSTLTITGADTVVVAADQGGNADYLAAPQVTQAITVGKRAQSILFTDIGVVPAGTRSVILSGTATSGLALSFSVLSGPATVAGNVLTVTGSGTVVVAADQVGDANHQPAAQVTQTVTVSTDSGGAVIAASSKGKSGLCGLGGGLGILVGLALAGVRIARFRR